MQRQALSRFLRDSRGGVAVEFVAIMGPFVLLVFFIMEVLIALFSVGTVEKAAQLGARLAVVSNPVATGVPATNVKVSGTPVPGVACSADPNACASFTATCTGSSGSGCVTTVGVYPCTNSAGQAATTPIDFIVCRMNNMSRVVTKNRVTVTYTSSGLGFYTGPTVPTIKLTISGVPYNTLILSIVNRLIGANALTVMPTISVTLTGEDLSSAGAS